jgi:hypothetical protein
MWQPKLWQWKICGIETLAIKNFVVIKNGGNQKPFWSPQGVLQLK